MDGKHVGFHVENNIYTILTNTTVWPFSIPRNLKKTQRKSGIDGCKKHYCGINNEDDSVIVPPQKELQIII